MIAAGNGGEVREGIQTNILNRITNVHNVFKVARIKQGEGPGRILGKVEKGGEAYTVRS